MTITHRTARDATIPRALCAFLPALLAMGAAQAGDLTVTIQGLQRGSAQGASLHVALFSASGFLQKALVEQVAAPAAEQLVFRDLPAGRYAATAYLDLNGNQTLDRNLFGAPLEPTAISNDAVGRMGPPSFDAAAFEVGAAASAITLRLPQ